MIIMNHIYIQTAQLVQYSNTLNTIIKIVIKIPFFLMLLYFCALVGIAFKYYNPTDVYPGEGNMSTVSSGQS